MKVDLHQSEAHERAEDDFAFHSDLEVFEEENR